jgi:hypothetical protein
MLTNENYFSQEASQKYLSVSQYKNFIGSLGKTGCEARAMAELNGEWSWDDKSTALLVGSYVDAHFEGSLNIFKSQNPEIFTQKGELKAQYKQAEEIIQRIERDKLFMDFMSGDKQTIMTAEMFGSPWKIKIDSYLKDKAIVDLKVMKSLDDRFYHKDVGGYLDFIQEWGYDIQGAIYQEVVYQNTGQRLPFFIAAASKEKVTNIEIIWVPDEHLQEKLIEVEQNTPKIMMLKNKEVEPVRCETCDYCRHTKVLKKPIHFSELLGVI